MLNRRWLAGWHWDLLGLAGAALLVAGLWQIYAPLAFVAGGLLLVLVATIGGKPWAS